MSPGSSSHSTTPQVPISSCTNHSDIQDGFVLCSIYPHCKLVFPRVAALRRADEEDGVLLCVADVDPAGVQGLVVLGPGHLGLRLSLEEPM